MKTSDIKNEMMDDIEDYAHQGKQQMKESSKDWLNYVEQHPLQSLLFGAVILLGLKGLFK